MAKDDDDITVQVDDLDTVTVNVEDDPALAQDPKSKKETVRIKPKDDPKPSGPSPEEALAQAQAFAKQQEDARKAAEATAASERARADTAERARQQAIKDAESYQQRAENSELMVIENSISNAQNELAIQKDAYVRAAESGEFIKMGDIQEKIAKAAAALDRLEDQKASVSHRQTLEPSEGRVQAPQVQNATDQFLSSFSPVAQNWLRTHMDCLPPQYGGDSVKNSKMMQGHYAATSQGIQEGSPDYFRVIEEHTGHRQPALQPQTPQTTQQPEPRTHTKVQHAAAPSRDVPDAATGQPAPRNAREVRLTKEQQEVAKMTWPDKTAQEAFGMYARNLIELEAEGKIGRTTH